MDANVAVPAPNSTFGDIQFPINPLNNNIAGYSYQPQGCITNFTAYGDNKRPLPIIQIGDANRNNSSVLINILHDSSRGAEGTALMAAMEAPPNVSGTLRAYTNVEGAQGVAQDVDRYIYSLGKYQGTIFIYAKLPTVE
jgi:hypothetical protein